MYLEGYLCALLFLGRRWESETSIAGDTLVDGTLSCYLRPVSIVISHLLMWLIVRCQSSPLLLSLLSLDGPAIFPFLYSGVCNE